MPGVVTELPLTGKVPGPSAIAAQLFGPTSVNVTLPEQTLLAHPLRVAVSKTASGWFGTPLGGEAAVANFGDALQCRPIVTGPTVVDLPSAVVKDAVLTRTPQE